MTVRTIPVTGTFTPDYDFGTTGDLSVGAGTKTGSYTLRDGICTFAITISASLTFTTASGNLLVIDLPFTAGEHTAVTISEMSNLGHPANRSNHTARIINNTTEIRFSGSGDDNGAVNIQASDMTSGDTVTMYISGSYRVA